MASCYFGVVRLTPVDSYSLSTQFEIVGDNECFSTRSSAIVSIRSSRRTVSTFDNFAVQDWNHYPQFTQNVQEHNYGRCSACPLRWV